MTQYIVDIDVMNRDGDVRKVASNIRWDAPLPMIGESIKVVGGITAPIVGIDHYVFNGARTGDVLITLDTGVY